jgi:hypothetical protein
MKTKKSMSSIRTSGRISKTLKKIIAEILTSIRNFILPNNLSIHLFMMPETNMELNNTTIIIILLLFRESLLTTCQSMSYLHIHLIIMLNQSLVS